MFHLSVAADGGRTPKYPLTCVASCEATRSEIVPSLLLWRGGTPGYWGVWPTPRPLVKLAQLVAPGPSKTARTTENKGVLGFSPGETVVAPSSSQKLGIRQLVCC